MFLVASPKDQVLGTRLLLVYVNDLSNVSRIYPDDINLFFNHKGIKYLFTVVITS